MAKNKFLTFLDETNYFLFELAIFFRQLAFTVTHLVFQVVIQDKMCININHYGYNICGHINKAEHKEIGDKVFADTASFTRWMVFLFGLPSFVWFPFLGSFLDNYPKKALWMLIYYIMIDLFRIGAQWANVLVFEASVYFVLLSTIPYWFSGGSVTWSACSYKFISETSTESTRSIRFVALHVAIVLGRSAAQFISSNILTLSSYLNEADGPMRTYNNNYYCNIGCNCIALVLFIVVYKLEQRRAARIAPTVNANGTAQSGKRAIRQDSTKLENGKIERTESDTNSTGSPNRKDPNDKSKDPKAANANGTGFCHFLRTVFSFTSMKQTWHTITKPREGKLRCQIFTLYGIILLLATADNGTDNTMLQFVEHAYCWTTQTYQRNLGIQNVTGPILVAVVSWVLFQWLKLKDGSVMVFGHFLPSLGCVLRGTILQEAVFFATIPVLCLFDLIGVSVRAKLSKIVPPNEVGTILSITALIDQSMWMLATFAFTSIFQSLIASYLGIVYHLSSGFLVLSLLCTVFEELYFKSPKRVNVEVVGEM